MASVNKAILIGNLGKDPEIKTTTSGQKCANLTIATSEKYTDRDNNRNEKTEWHNVVLWGKQAEFAERFLRKGLSVYLEGKITTRSWDDQATGKKVYKTEIVGSVLTILTPKESNHGEQHAGNGAPPPEDDPNSLPF